MSDQSDKGEDPGPDDDNVVIPARRELSIYWDKGGTITLFQLGDSDDDAIEVHPDDVPRIVAVLQNMAANRPGE